MTNFTMELYKKDGRRTEGRKLISTLSYDARDMLHAESKASGLVTPLGDDYSFEVHQTWREVRSVVGGQMVREHYTTPYSCSVASEAYWCN